MAFGRIRLESICGVIKKIVPWWVEQASVAQFEYKSFNVGNLAVNTVTSKLSFGTSDVGSVSL
jgi:hypothetical protein